MRAVRSVATVARSIHPTFSAHTSARTRGLSRIASLLPSPARTSRALLASSTSIRKMASATPLSMYESAHFPTIPRTHGCAHVCVDTVKSGDAAVTLVHFTTKAEMRGEAPAGSLAAADAERESVLVSYTGAAGSEQRVMRVCVGAKMSVEALRKATVAAVTKAKALKVKSLNFVLPASTDAVPAAKAADTVVQAAALSNYHFDRYLTAEEKIPSFVEKIIISSGAGAADAAVETAVKRAATLAECTIFARDICNERADEMHPARVEAVARQLASESGAALTVIAGDDLVKNGMHLMHAVGQAARHSPRYIELVHRGDPEHPDDVILLVGKGVCYDTGGLNIKPTGSMEDMHMDKGGAAAVLGAALAAYRLGLKRNIVFVVGAVENAVDALSYKPHAVIRSHKGLSVEIGNTDAEGRLVLADALSMAQQRHKPHTVFDFATLTGACVVALGEYAAGVFSNNAKLASALVSSGERVFERCWHLPILPEHREELKGTPFADLKSTGESRYGGASIAAAFLENFIGYEPAKNGREAAAAPTPAPDAEAPAAKKPVWAHIDIAGPGMYSRDRGHMKKGGTGFGVQLIIDYLTNAAAGAPSSE